MTQVKEGVKPGPPPTTTDGESKCDHSKSKKGWRAVLAGKTAGHLIPNLKRDRQIEEPIWPPPGGKNSIKSVEPGTPGQWPHEAHHLIPWQELPKHAVKGYVKSGKGAKVFADANYSINHGANGKYLPFASDLAEWKNNKNKQGLAEQMMAKLGLQLHQSRHSTASFGSGKKGYKARVAELLDNVVDSEEDHIDICDECEAKKKKDKLPPREQITRKLDGVSRRLEAEINSCDIFVSRRAYLAWDNGTLKAAP